MGGVGRALLKDGVEPTWEGTALATARKHTGPGFSPQLGLTGNPPPLQSSTPPLEVGQPHGG